MIIKILMVGAGGFVGAVARYTLSDWVHRFSKGSFPHGTLIVNVLGCFFIGILMGWVQVRHDLTPNQRLILITGFLGSLTTFSTFGYETLALLENGYLKLGLGNIATNLVLGILSVYLGVIAVKFLP